MIPLLTKTQKVIITLVLLGISVFSLIIKLSGKSVLYATLRGTPLVLEVADTDSSRARGLSSHAPLESGHGMLFEFPSDGGYGIWMKDMSFPIDIIWLDKDYRVVDTKTHAKPESYPEIFIPRVLARYVLEVGEGFLDEHRISIGDILEITSK
ncbi:MAG: hypothetical protein UY07_C0009G0017 [Parcubacteria group bacterium GW2011_GWA1_47_8]|nr:MAG: hypothetical protein UY07_C0009G0017 [Parcubacteria group bacterium GW2011_GWA1_47_8]KKW07929.1 MAG: hypothetical protein UY42_C0003G0021 [Parcubacteria group bacterium GW2011_GWA2_49_16]